MPAADTHRTIEAVWHIESAKIIGGLARIVQAISDDERAVMTCSIVNPEVAGVQNIALSLPRIVGLGGVLGTIHPHLDEGVLAALARSAGFALREA